METIYCTEIVLCRLGKVFKIPKRSPDLNVMDYAIWAEVEKRLRKQEHAWNTQYSDTCGMYANMQCTNQ